MKPASSSMLPTASWSAVLLVLLGLAGCGGSTGPAGPAGSDATISDGGITTGTTLTGADNSPGVVLDVTSVAGATGPSGTFKVGDRPKVTFTIKKTNGNAWHLSELASGRIWLSGPTNNYQRVIAQQTDLIAQSVVNGDGTYTYTFAPPGIPANYLTPLYGTNGVGTDNLGGTALVDGTYTIAMAVRWNYTVDGVAKKDVANITEPIRIGPSATVVETREVVKNDNCNLCHVKVQAHGGGYNDTKTCVTCHTAGAMDLVSAVPVEFKQMIHKIHNGGHLPSVNGVTVDGSGNRLYTGSGTPYTITGYQMSVNDFSDVQFPAFPSFSSGMPKPLGYSAIAADTTVLPGATSINSKKKREDILLKGVVSCYKCHGDPDGAGPKTAPNDGDNCNSVPSRRACGSCHDDIKWDQAYIRNGMTMPAQANDTACGTCHATSGTSPANDIAVTGGNMAPTPYAHVHPLANRDLVSAATTYTTGLEFSATAGGNTGASWFNAGDKPTVTFSVTDEDGVNVPLYKLSGTTAAITGPNNNRQLVFPMNGTRSSTYTFCDFSGRLVKAAGSGATGTMSRVVGSTVSEPLKVQFTSATAFTVTAGATETAMGGFALAASPSTNPSGSSLTEIELSPTAVQETITVNFTSSTAFDVTGSVSGAIGSGVLSNDKNASVRFVSTPISFTLNSGTTIFAANNKFHLAVCVTSSNGHRFAILAGRTAGGAFASGDRFYYETVDNAATTYTYNVPMEFLYEFIGTGTGASQAYAAANLPVYYGRELVYEVTALPAADTTTSACVALGRSVSVTTPASFAIGDTVIIDRTTVGQREALVVYGKVGSTLTFSTPFRYAHNSGVSIEKATLTQRYEGATGTYTVTPGSGITGTFGNGNAVLMSYRTDGAFGWYRHTGDARQDVYPTTIFDSAGMGQDWAKWQGLAFQAGTYNISLWGSRPLYLAKRGETQTYRVTSRAAGVDFRFGSSGTIAPYNLISDEQNCESCHVDVLFHGGGRKGHDACASCHGVVGFEDAPPTTTTDATPQLTFNFRTFLHKVHMGEELANASTFMSGSFAEIVFPAMPEPGARACATCHGASNTAWKEPADRAHAAQTTPAKNWKAVCNSCHDSTAATAHMDANTTSGGTETCGTCHGAGQIFSVETVHKAR
jgi:hypothetical protein